MITKNINNIAENLRKNLTNNIKAKGKDGLSLALDYVRPYFLSLGLRVARLSSTQIEMVIPSKLRNRAGTHFLHEGVLASALVEAVHALWSRNKPNEDLRLVVQTLHVDYLKPLKSDLRLRIEMGEVSRESTLAQLQRSQVSEQELQAKFFDVNEILVAEAQVKLKLSVSIALEWK